MASPKPKKPAVRSNTSDITVTQAVDLFLERALERGASDVHIEPREHTVVVRYRIDGWLREAAKFPLTRLGGVLKHIKKRAELSIADTLPQTGTAAYDSSFGLVVLDIATLPTIHGEKVTLHLKPQLTENATLENLGYWGETLRDIEYAVAEPHGLVLASSPNNTSVSMNLLAMVHLLNNPALDVATLESPVLQRIPGVSQTDLKPGAPFATYLQAALKQDPNVVMLSSLQDPATIKLSIQAALNGRLIMGGVHAGNSAQAVQHVLHMHPEPYMVAAALKVVLNQHFVRQLCLHCRETYLPKAEERKKLSGLLAASGITTVRAIQELETRAMESGLGTDQQRHILPLSTGATRITHLWRASQHGCQYCHFTGYFGRLGVCEAMVIHDSLRTPLAKGLSSAALRKHALAEGMIPFQLDGFIKALRGLTSMDEIFRLPPLPR